MGPSPLLHVDDARISQPDQSHASPSKASKVTRSFIPESTSVHARHFKNPKDYLSAVIDRTILSEVEPEKGAKRGPNLDSFGAEIFTQVAGLYKKSLLDNFKQRINEGMVDKFFAPEDLDQNVDELNQKHAIQEQKRDLEKQILGLRMKHNAMLKSEFEAKMKQLQDKWAEVESLTIEDPMPGREDIEQMVGLTGKQAVKKSLHEMLKSKTKEDYIIEEANAKQFIKSMKL